MSGGGRQQGRNPLRRFCPRPTGDLEGIAFPEKCGMPRKEKPKIGFSSIILFWHLGVAIDSLEE